MLYTTTTMSNSSSIEHGKHTLSQFQANFSPTAESSLGSVNLRESTLYITLSTYIKSVEPTLRVSSNAKFLQLLVLKLPAHVLGFQLATIHWHLSRSFRDPFMVFICAAPASCSHFSLHRCYSLRRCSR